MMHGSTHVKLKKE